MLICRAKPQVPAFRGFTLIEMMVVIGIIAVLTAIVAPNMFNFSDKGRQGAMDQERASVQTAMKAMMSTKGITTLNALSGPTNASNAWDTMPTGAKTEFLEDYLERSPTDYFYCWDDQGNLTEQYDAITACT